MSFQLPRAALYRAWSLDTAEQAARLEPSRRSARSPRRRRSARTDPESDLVETYQLQCPLTGRVKMYKSMSSTEARALDHILYEHGSTCRWLTRSAAAR